MKQLSFRSRRFLVGVGLFLLVMPTAGAESPAEKRAAALERIRVCVERRRLDPAFPPDSFPSYRDVLGAFDASLARYYRSLIEARSGSRDSAMSDCRMVAYVYQEICSRDLLLREVDRTATLTPKQAKYWLRADSLRLHAKSESSAGRHDSSAVAQDSASVLFAKAGDERLAALSLIGVVDARAGLRGLDPQILADFHVLLSHARGSEDDLLICGVEYWRARLFEQRGQSDSALASFGRVEDASRRVRDWHGLIYALEEKGRLLLSEDSAEEGLKAFAEIRRIGLRIREAKMQARGEVGLARAFSALGQPDSALFCGRNALRLSRESNDEAGSVKAMRALSHVFFGMGLFDSSVVYNRLPLPYHEKRGDFRNVAGCAYSLALSLWYQGRTEEALRYAEQAYDAARRVQLRWVEGYAANLQGNHRVSVGEPAAALPWFERALEVARLDGNRELEIYATANRGNALQDLGNLAEARSDWEKSIALCDSLGPGEEDDWDLRGLPLMAIAWSCFLEGDTARAHALAADAYDLAHRCSSGGDYGRMSASSLLGWLAGVGHPDEAERYLRESLTIARARGESERWALLSLADIAWSRGQVETCFAQMDSAMSALESERASVGPVGSRPGWFGEQIAGLERGVERRLERREPEQAFQFFERMKARELLDLLQGGNLAFPEVLSPKEKAVSDSLTAGIESLNRRLGAGETAARDRLDELRHSHDAFEQKLFRVHPELREQSGKGHILSSAEACSLIAPDEVALLYSLGWAQVSLLAVTREGIRGILLPTPSDSVRAIISNLRRAQADGKILFLSGDLAALYRQLLTPVADLLERSKRLCIVPDNELCTVPFHMLINPESGRHVVEQWSTYVTPSLSALAALRRTSAPSGDRLLVVAGPEYGTAPVRTNLLAQRGELKPLAFAAEEGRTLRELYGDRAELLAGRDATEGAFARHAPGAGILHLAMHAFVEDADPFYSSLAFSQPDSVDDGFLEAREIIRMKLGARLAVLSACETGSGRITPGEGILGLTHAFFTAGTRSVVASLWPVEDESTALLMERFHRHLMQGQSPVEALAAAQRALKKEFPRFASPYYWGGFVLYGAPD